MKYLASVLICLCAITTLANDGINRKKRKVVKPRKPQVIKVVEVARWRVEKPKLPSILEATVPGKVSLVLKPTQPLFDIPPEPLPVTSEVRTYPFEQDDKSLSPWWFALSALAIPFLIPHGDDQPGPSPQPTQFSLPTPETSQVPEPSGLVLLGTALLLTARRRVRK